MKGESNPTEGTVEVNLAMAGPGSALRAESPPKRGREGRKKNENPALQRSSQLEQHRRNATDGEPHFYTHQRSCVAHTHPKGVFFSVVCGAATVRRSCGSSHTKVIGSVYVSNGIWAT